ncbi:hypothetical protein AXG93_2318s1210 [Marchantia polymorpha subsp. ruderalis]|uniref:Uncharacterized protein n=1 Tax=Marchantia polymorpha subsp. ruderalis TaxID=1480154 RepID=A0A176VN86_MARPO|nr:hypothetical protein AXG93_2318s1210 [Marchantia polymorpha subsp. ruderalis]
MNKNETEGEDIRGNPMLWTIEHWAKVMGSCAGSDRNLLFEKSSVGLTRTEEFSYGPLFSSGRQGTNGWKTADYLNPKRRAIALEIMHILRLARTTYVTAWQIGFFKRILNGQRVHWARIFYDLVWVNASLRWTGPLVNHLTPFLVNFYRGMSLLTRKEEKRFPRERENLTAKSSERTEDDTRQPSIPPQTTARGPSGGRYAETREARTAIGEEKESVLDSSVEKTVAPIVSIPEVAVCESIESVEIEVPSGVPTEVQADVPAEPLKERIEMVSPNSLSSERTRSVGSEDTEEPQPKTNEELVKELTLSDEILEQVFAHVEEMVIDAADIALPSSPVEDVRPEEEKKTSEEKSKGVEITFPDFLQDSVVPLMKYLDRKREKYAMSKERAAILSTECGAAKAALKEREARLREKEIECEVLQLNLAKESRRCAELEETCGGLRIFNENGHKMTVDLLARLEKSREAYDEAVKRSEQLIATAERREKNHVKELAKLEFRRAEEVRIAEELRGKIAEAKTVEEDLRRLRVSARRNSDMWRSYQRVWRRESKSMKRS